MIGTLVVGSLTAQLRDPLPFWEVLMALFFIAVVLVFPRGIAGVPLRSSAGLRGGARAAALAAPGAAAARPPAKLALDGMSVHVGEVTILERLRSTSIRPASLRHRPERGRQDLDVQRGERRAPGAGGRSISAA